MSDEPNPRRYWFPWRLTTVLLALALVAMTFVAVREHTLKKRALHKARSRARAARKVERLDEPVAPVDFPDP
jgi:hypothetical protein